MLLEKARKVLKTEAEAILRLSERLDGRFAEAVEMMAACRGRVVTTGMGKSGIICRKIAATLSSTGTPSLFLHPAEALHGDLGMLAPGDIVLALSNSGETPELLRLLETVKRLGILLISLVGRMDSTLARNSEVSLDVGVQREACPMGLAPTASTTAALALGDALALCLSELRGFRLDDFARLHPGGKLGLRLARVCDLMHVDQEIPSVDLSAPMEDVIYEMSRKGLGIAAVVDNQGKLCGVISDGDLRRLLQKRKSAILTLSAGECMTPNPVTISQEELATAALNLMEHRKITCLMVTGPSGFLSGVIHLHDLWGTEMI